MRLDAAQVRVLGCLLEKQRTTPDQYPLSLNALRLACNQTTNRDPVVTYDERTVHEAAQALGRVGWARLASGAGSRAVKYRQLVTDALGLDREEAAVLTVLMLRGAQTPGELKQRTDRLHPFGGLTEVEEALRRLLARELVERVGRRPGQKEDRFRHLLGDDDADAEAASVTETATAAGGGLEQRVSALETEVAELRALVARLGIPTSER